MYAIVFDLDLGNQAITPESPKTPYHDIKKTLENYGFYHYHCNLYIGDVSKVDAVTCVLAVMDLAKQNPWFAPSVSDIRMLRIEDNNDLMPAVKKAVA